MVTIRYLLVLFGDGDGDGDGARDDDVDDVDDDDDEDDNDYDNFIITISNIIVVIILIIFVVSIVGPILFFPASGPLVTFVALSPFFGLFSRLWGLSSFGWAAALGDLHSFRWRMGQ